MEVRNCKSCGRLYNYIGGVSYYNICPKCVENLEDKFQEAKKYIEENVNVGVREVAEAVGVKPQQVERWVREERLCFAENSGVGIGCEKCGMMIRSGRYCPECKDAMTKTLSSMYASPGISVVKTKKGSADARMRYLDN